MARLPRLYIEGCAQHVIQRGNNREACFYDQRDYKAYLSFLNEAADQYRVAIHAFVLMTNHTHLLATPADSYGIGRMMQALGRKYVQYFNYTHNRTGTLWEGRYKSTLVDSEYLRLGKTDKERQQQYRLLFREIMVERDIDEIRAATNKAWVLGCERFKAQIEEKTGRRTMPAGRGGDRKSARFLRGSHDQ